MRKVIIILLGLISIFGSCNKTIPSVQFKYYENGVLSKAHWVQISGPSQLIFDANDTSTVNTTTNNPKVGVYVLQANGITATITVTKN